MRQEIGIFINKLADPRRRSQAIDLSHKISGVEVKELSFPMSSIPENIGIAISVGGDGTARTVTEELLKRENPGFLAVFPGGSQNGFYHSLVDAGAVITVEQLRDQDIKTIPYFRPGIISGKIFNLIADLTKAGVMQAEESERIRRFIPRKLRAHVGVSIAWVKLSTSEDYPRYETKTFMTSPFIGSFKIFHKQRLHSDALTCASMNAGNKEDAALKLAAFLIYMLAGAEIPSNIMEFTTNRSFQISNLGRSEINADGEVVPISREGTIFVARNPKPLQAAALLLK